MKKGSPEWRESLRKARHFEKFLKTYKGAADELEHRWKVAWDYDEMRARANRTRIKTAPNAQVELDRKLRELERNLNESILLEAHLASQGCDTHEMQFSIKTDLKFLENIKRRRSQVKKKNMADIADAEIQRTLEMIGPEPPSEYEKRLQDKILLLELGYEDEVYKRYAKHGRKKT